MKVLSHIEKIFSYAAALHESGRQRNTVYCMNRDVFILNNDHTLLLKFRLTEGTPEFDPPLSFAASDYDSKEFRERDGRIEFIQRGKEEVIRTKSCRAPKYSPEDVRQMFRSLGKPRGSKVSLNENAARKWLDEKLSHVEFRAEGGRLIVAQRNIYTGAVIEIRKDEGGWGIGQEGLEDFGPIGLRTNDFLALYSHAKSIAFWFGSNGVVHIRNEGGQLWDMKGVLSQCMYDELGGIQNGRKESKVGGSESETD